LLTPADFVRILRARIVDTGSFEATVFSSEKMRNLTVFKIFQVIMNKYRGLVNISKEARMLPVQ